MQRLKNLLPILSRSILPHRETLELASVIRTHIANKSFVARRSIWQNIENILSPLNDIKEKFEWKLNMKDDVRQYIASLDPDPGGDRLQRTTEGGDHYNHYLKELLIIPTTKPCVISNHISLEYNAVLYECLSKTSYIHDNELDRKSVV